MAPDSHAPALVPVPASDPLFVDTLRCGLDCYIRGDYERAKDRFLDASALAPYRPEAACWRAIGELLEMHLEGRTLVSRDAAIPHEAQIRR